MSPFGQDDECRLKSILSELMITKNAATDAVNLRPMAANQLGKRIIRI
jgi:hypothetical protein